jgi:3-methylcrotonyl-CoA carboxylase alpha subunit
MFSSVLVANRGEVACRIMRTAKRLGLKTIAVYSEADAKALHVREADEAYLIGPAPARESYLDIDRVIAAATRSGAQCIHPGYGFLSENPEFAEACRRAGIVFVGPPAEAIRAMGHKDAAKQLMSKAGVPVVPGYQGRSQTERTLAKAADGIGYPVMIKAVAGGGGKGMRRVDARSAFAEALASCRREAQAAFGDDRVLIEKFIADPRHIEVQIIADMFGTCIHLYERDCSLQRRHQKVIEEAPAPKLPLEIRTQMCEAAVAAAEAVGYVGAGTVEFIAATRGDGEVADFYFMEMNTRLQVEHPVSEMILGLDLVELQLRIAAGEPLPLKQEAVAPTGHAIEARLYAENPASGFLPQTGVLHVLDWPSNRRDIRIDTGVEAGTTVTAYYDPMIAKLIAWGSSRPAAIARLSKALRDTTVLGIASNSGFLERIIAHPDFAAGGATTAFIDTHLDQLIGEPLTPDVLAAAARAWAERGETANEASGWALAGLPRKDIHAVTINGEPVRIEVAYQMNGREIAAITRSGRIAIAEEAAPCRSFFDAASETLFIALGGAHITMRAEDVLTRTSGPGEGAAVIHAPMSGKVIAVLVEHGQDVAAGQPLLILDAMKMEHVLKAGVDGTIARLLVSAGSQVKEGDVVCVIGEAHP